MAFDHAPVGIVLTERRVIGACNLTFAELFGWERDALIGQSFRLLYETEQEFEAIRDIGLAPLRDSGSYTDERLIRRRDGARRWCRFRARTLTPAQPLDRLVMTFAPLPRPAAPAVALTPRERDVISGLSRGETSKEIARKLGLSPRSVEDVRARLLRKFDVRNAAELLARLTGPAVSG
ncbi:LuxR family transcriptional regulator [Oceanicola sp. 22II-s10i]|uniref:PAS and helix-turn-helix domain-containing protein n=1 Tax=Oceanicola sp. 22II-s10i TaxID=1317116 RepID=UPI000B690741|nr:PAS and helix-turn-helix domain-containing protein [Oceanicola sp. 22II-s10i]OWU85788.1 LuxR family transcriptional regulator [Oceanicola sp. 22II-s10i]